MAEATVTNVFRRRLAAYHATGNNAPGKVMYMDFGDGGHNPNGTAKEADPSQTELNNKRLRKALKSVVQEDLYSVTGTAQIATDELVGVSISEAGIVDANGILLGFRNFVPKVKAADEVFEITIKLKF